MTECDKNLLGVFSTLGASNHSKSERDPHDFYATPPLATELLLGLEKFSDLIWEPACGNGDMCKVLESNGYRVLATDLIQRNYGRGGIDFLSTHEKFEGDIITNPPYSIAQEFVEHAIELVAPERKVAMFLRLSFLEGKRRAKLFSSTPPKTVYVASGRFNCGKNGIFQTDSKSAVAHAWFIWEKGYKGETILKWFH